MSAAPAATQDRVSPADANRSSSPLIDTATLTASGDGNLPMRSAGHELAAAHGRRLVPWSGVAKPRPHLPLGAVAFVLMVALPMAFAGIYYFFIAADQYVAEFRFGLRSAEPVRIDPGVLLQAGAAPSQIGLDSYVVVQYIASRAIVDDLSRTLDLQHFNWYVRELHSSKSASATVEPLGHLRFSLIFPPAAAFVITNKRAQAERLHV